MRKSFSNERKAVSKQIQTSKVSKEENVLTKIDITYTRLIGIYEYMYCLLYTSRCV